MVGLETMVKARDKHRSVPTDQTGAGLRPAGGSVALFHFNDPMGGEPWPGSQVITSLLANQNTWPGVPGSQG